MFASCLARAASALPSQCAICRAWPAQSICSACLDTFAATQARCSRCALPLPPLLPLSLPANQALPDAPAATAAPSLAQHAPRVCGACLRLGTTAALGTCLAAVDYAYPWSGLLTRFKFRGEPGLAAQLAALMRLIPHAQALIASCDLVLAVPLSRERLRERGFNQALLLALALAPRKTDAHLLLRLRHTRPQSELPRSQRLQNLQGAFGLEPLRAPAVAGRHVLLVDDVMTTGTSLQTAAQTLRQAGARQVDALVLARTPDWPD